MQRTFIITGAAGHLGCNIVSQLMAFSSDIRALLLPYESLPCFAGAGHISVYYGDVRDKSSLEPLFAGLDTREVVVIHAAGIVDICTEVSDLLYDVNVKGTKHMVELAIEHQVKRFIYISSVHAIPELEDNQTITEIEDFLPRLVVGGYAKTKAEATALVLDAAKERGLPAVVLHPSGIIGPLDVGRNNMVEALRCYLSGRLHLCPKGGYNLVDVRDVAAACIAAVDKARPGESYILAGNHYDICELFAMLDQLTGKKRRFVKVPLKLIAIFAPVMERVSLLRKHKPLFTKYSITALGSNDNFSNCKAKKTLGFLPRDIISSLQDTVTDLGFSLRKKTKSF